MGTGLLARAPSDSRTGKLARDPAAEPGYDSTKTVKLGLSELPRALLHPGVQVGSWILIRPLGEGGYGRVYEARDAKTGKRVAIKLLAQREKVRKSFEREARAGRISSPYVPRVLGFGAHLKTPFLVLELVKGESLASRLFKSRLRAREVARVGGKLAEALAAVHSSGLVHRDLKAGNVILDREGNPKLIDFGFAATPEEVDREGAVGTAGYWAPELYGRRKGEPVDGAAADLYSLGCLLHLMATQFLPHAKHEREPRTKREAYRLVARRARGGRRADRQHLKRVPPKLRRVILQLLDRDPSARPSAAQVAKCLEALSQIKRPSARLARLGSDGSDERSSMGWGWASRSSVEGPALD
jgi:serine/threonine protein kinase